MQKNTFVSPEGYSRKAGPCRREMKGELFQKGQKSTRTPGLEDLFSKNLFNRETNDN